MPTIHKQNPRILITRLSHIGDCILTLPLANAIKRAMPGAFIAWAIESPGNHLIDECPAVDEVITIPKGWLKKPATIWKLRREFKNLKFDVAIDPQSLTKSAGLAWISGAKTRVGLASPIGRELSPWLNNRLAKVTTRHVVDRSVEMLKAIGIPPDLPSFDIRVPNSAQASAEQWTQELELQKGYVVINPGAGWKSRQWCNQRFGKVAEYIGRTLGLKSLVTWFGDTEEQMVDAIQNACPEFVVKAPSTRLWELAALIQQSRFYIGCDTGPTHLAAAIGIPCATLFGTTEPEVSGPYESDPKHPRHLRIQKYYQAGSSRERRKAENHAMLAIEVDDVTRALHAWIPSLATKAA